MSDYELDDFRTEVDEHGNIKVTSYVEAVVISKEEQEQMQRIFKQLQEENAKLRKLLSQALAARELKTFFEYFEPHSFWAGWCEDVHKMGIEVGK